jgi:hypothetical protein
MSRLDYSPETQLRERLSDRLITVDPNAFTDLSAQCGEATNGDGWILFVTDARLRSDVAFATYFETAEEPVGMWMELDAGFLRLGLGLGLESMAWNTEIPVRWVRSDQRETIIIGVTRDQTRVIANAVDKKAPWPGDLADIWRCNAVQIGSDTRQLSEGKGCAGCNTSLRYATGTERAELIELMDSLANVRTSNARRLLGSVLTMAGVLLVWFAPRVALRVGRSGPILRNHTDH